MLFITQGFSYLVLAIHNEINAISVMQFVAVECLEPQTLNFISYCLFASANHRGITSIRDKPTGYRILMIIIRGHESFICASISKRECSGILRIILYTTNYGKLMYRSVD